MAESKNQPAQAVPPYMNIKEFVEGGYLQEANRRFFHPLGLALVVWMDAGAYSLKGVFDARYDPEGYRFAAFDDADRAKAANIEKELEARSPARLEKLGYVIQPIVVVEDESAPEASTT